MSFLWLCQFPQLLISLYQAALCEELGVVIECLCLVCLLLYSLHLPVTFNVEMAGPAYDAVWTGTGRLP